MKIKDILRDDFEFNGDIAIDIKGIAYDSRKVKQGDLFAAIRGENVDGHDFIGDSINKGAVSVIYEKIWANAHFFRDKYPEIAWIGASDTREAVAYLASRFYNNPSEEISLIGITGTNGKTSTSYIIKKILERCGHDTGLIGTIGYLIRSKFHKALHTTPEAADFQELLRKMADEGCRYVVSEVSSHALFQKRVDYSRFKTAVFTNLTQDHLDFHMTMESYYKSKERLFTELLVDGGYAVINIDNPYGERLLGELKKSRGSALRYLTYSIDSPLADLRALNINIAFKGLSFTVRQTGLTKDLSGIEIQSGLIGMPNVYNLLASIGSAISLGIPAELIKEAVRGLSGVRGRFERVDAGQDFLAIVDYAHTDDALAGLLATARQLIKNGDLGRRIVRAGAEEKSFFGKKIITVFGCGGNRDRGKRAKMAEAATRLSDYVIMTTDNPRFEEPMDILRDMEKGTVASNYLMIPNRRLAIQMAVEMASSGDIVLVAGKGHEDYQEIKGVCYAFCDRTELANAISKIKGR
jgi:UDP-N-acetylmuramoyl-L-alanyl-D-glutamate--2,6-diaminopimelate ligase